MKWRGIIGAITFFIFCPFLSAQEGRLKVHFINVGYGDSILLENPDKTTWLIDAAQEKKGQAQLIKASYTRDKDIVPNQFTVKVNQPVRFEIAVNEDGQGCMGSITLPGLTNQVYGLTKGQPIIFEFTPTTIGAYNITCAMGVPRGIIQVI